MIFCPIDVIPVLFLSGGTSRPGEGLPPPSLRGLVLKPSWTTTCSSISEIHCASGIASLALGFWCVQSAVSFEGSWPISLKAWEMAPANPCIMGQVGGLHAAEATPSGRGFNATGSRTQFHLFHGWHHLLNGVLKIGGWTLKVNHMLALQEVGRSIVRVLDHFCHHFPILGVQGPRRDIVIFHHGFNVLEGVQASRSQSGRCLHWNWPLSRLRNDTIQVHWCTRHGDSTDRGGRKKDFQIFLTCVIKSNLSQNGSAILAVNVCTHNPCKCKHSKFQKIQKKYPLPKKTSPKSRKPEATDRWGASDSPAPRPPEGTFFHPETWGGPEVSNVSFQGNWCFLKQKVVGKWSLIKKIFSIIGLNGDTNLECSFWVITLLIIASCWKFHETTGGIEILLWFCCSSLATHLASRRHPQRPTGLSKRSSFFKKANLAMT